MNRIQIRLTEEQHGALRRLARGRGVSMASVIRDALDAEIIRQERRRVVEALRRGGFDSGRPDIAEHHDDPLAEAYLA